MKAASYQPRWPPYMQSIQRLGAEPLLYELRASYLPMLRQKAPLETVLGSSNNNRYQNLATVAAYQVCISGTLSI
ncbi:hypothetical protein QR685DRAFT_570502 [Neurospora intermedia]|uniref:Uncharacterized protein n=1 Tax=Neurospora intermedia TaxID=5142 RepID=A0ABR3DIZ5_NEUIN